MHQGDQKVEQYTNANRVTSAIVTPKSEDVSHSIPIYLPLLASPIPTLELLSLSMLHAGVRILLDSKALKYAFLNHVVS